MAKSDYDTMAFDEAGQPCNGTFITKGGTIIECYKNWLHVGHPRMWREEAHGLCKPWIGLVNAGDTTVRINEVEFTTKRCPQNGMFFLAKWAEYPLKNPRAKKWEDKYGYDQHIVGGIVSSGYATKIPACLRKRGITSLDGFGSSSDSDGNHHVYPPNSNLRRGIKVPRDPWYWAGIKPATVKAFFKWAAAEVKHNDVHEAWLAKCVKSGGLRFNQGDAIFARHFKIPIAGTPAGQADKPLIGLISSHLKEEKKV